MAQAKIQIKVGSDMYEILHTDFYFLLGIVKELQGRIWNPSNKIWTVDNTPENLQEILPYVDRDSAERIKFRLENDALPENMEMLDNYHFLYPFQKKGINELLGGKKLLASDVGLGKTIQAMVYAKIKGHERILVVCPAPLKRQWQQELKKFLNEDAYILEGKEKDRQNILNYYVKGFLITNYEQLRINKIPEFDLIIFDEVHRIKNSTSQTYNAARRLITKDTIGMTATPMVNNPRELYTIMQFLFPNFMPWQRFSRRYCVWNSIWTGYNYIETITHYKNLPELNEYLKPLMVRHRKPEVLAELPPRIYKNYFIKANYRQTELIQEFMNNAREAFLEFLADRKERNEMLGWIQLARLACDGGKNVLDSESVILKETYQEDELSLCIRETDNAKLQAVKEILIQLEGKTLIFTQWKNVARELMQHIDNACIITGDTKNKIQTIEEFQRSSKKILISTDCLNYGANLQFVQNLIHYDLPWSPSRIEQREGRIDRIGQKHKMLIFKLIIQDSFEDYILDILMEKQSMFNTVVDGMEIETNEGMLRELFNRITTKKKRK